MKQVLCINSDWYMDPETGKTAVTFISGKTYRTFAPRPLGIESLGDTIVVNEQGSRHIIKTEDGLSDFFNRYFRFVEVNQEER